MKAPAVPLPAELVADTPYPEIPEPMKWGDSIALNVEAFSAIGQCNLDKAGIRKIDAERVKPESASQ